MNNNKHTERIVEIIRGYYDLQPDGDSENRDLIKSLFEDWIVQDEDSLQKMKIIEQLWDQESGDAQAMTPEKIYAMAKRMGLSVPEQRESKKRSISLKRWALRVAAVLIPVAILIGSVLVIGGNKQTFNAQYAALNGEIKTCELGDGSIVTINSGGELNIDQDKKSRKAELSGEAYFKISRDEDRPFTIKTDNFIITVLGTEFNVESYGDRLYSTVTVTDGLVIVSTTGGQKWMLHKGEKFILDRNKSEGIVRTHDIDAEGVSWMNGWLVCDLMTLQEIFNSLERRLNIDIEVDASASLPDTRYSVRISLNEGLSNILDVLDATSYDSFSYEIRGNKVIISEEE